MITTLSEGTMTTFKSKTSVEQTNDRSRSGSSIRVPTNSGNLSSLSSSPSALEGKDTDGNPGTAILEMSSADSAGNPHSSGTSCGIVSSLFPSSCRGRAEAFARRLHRRLTSLGSEDDSPDREADGSKPCETTWLHPSSSRISTTTNATTNYVLQRQPRHSPESDLFYAIDLELEEEDGPGSPAEEATAADLANLLVNPEILKTSHHDSSPCLLNGIRSTSMTNIHRDPESECVFASPIDGTPPDSDTSEVFFDPESSDTDKLRNEVFYDPITTSESDVTSNLSNGYISGKGKAMPNYRRKDKNVEQHESESSSCSSTKKSVSCENHNQQEAPVCSSEDSLNGKSSQDTTSPSNESLWSTFDESTVSLQDENLPRVDSDSVMAHNCLPKSHSDSELPVNNGGTVMLSRLVRSDVIEEDKENIDDINLINSIIDDCTMEESISDSINHANDDHPKIDAANVDSNKEKLMKTLSQLKTEDTATSDADTDRSIYSSTITIPGALTLECPTGARVIEANRRNEIKLEIEDVNLLQDSDEKKMCLLLTKLNGSSIDKEEDSSPSQDSQGEIVEEEEEEDEEEDRPQKIRRSSSLKTGKTPPGTPGRKKIVRFADVLGLDLADVRTYLDEIPKVPNSAYNDLIYDDLFQKDSSPVNTISNDCCSTNDRNYESTPMTSSKKLGRMLVPLFQQPGGMTNFLDLVRERRVCLENVVVEDPVTLSIQGTVRVINLDFHKSVHIRYTLNSWQNFSDLQATYVQNSCDGFSDKFSFVLYCHTLPIGQRLEFAVRFHCKGMQYWDNNAGANYCFQCLPSSSPIRYTPITESKRTNWDPVFY